MRNLFTTIAMVLAMAVASFAQSTVATAGGEATSDGSMSFTIGQTVYTSVSGEGGTLSQGVQQAYVITAETGIDLVEIQLRAFPNPTNDVLNLMVDGGDYKKVTYALYNNSSKLMTKGMVSGSEAQISMATYKAGVYFLDVKAEGKTVKRFKIIKN